MTTPPKAPAPVEPSWLESLDELCPVCDRRKGSHTLDEYVLCLRQRVHKLKDFLQ